MVKVREYWLRLLYTEIMKWLDEKVLLFLYNLTVYKNSLYLITKALCNIAESSSSGTVASIRNESLNEALILEGIAALFRFMEKQNIIPNMTYISLKMCTF